MNNPETPHASIRSPFARPSKDLVVFDLDGTLTETKRPIDEEMAQLIARLLETKSVAIISGGAFDRFERRILPAIQGLESRLLANLFLLPTSGAAMYRYDRDEWVLGYSHNLTSTEKDKIFDVLRKVLAEGRGIAAAPKTYGEVIEDRGGQVTFSALGRKAPVELKKRWDPAHEKRRSLVAVLSSLLPEFNIHIGGDTSIDITEKGIDKAYGVREISRHLGIPIERALYVGNAIFPDGNDYPAAKSGADFVQVKNVAETEHAIRDLLGE